MKKIFGFLICSAVIVMVTAVFIITKFNIDAGKAVSVNTDEVSDSSALIKQELSVIKMYSPTGETVYTETSDIKMRELNGWYSEPVGIMKKDAEEKCVVLSDFMEYRSDGWFASEYCNGLSGLCNDIKTYMKSKSGKWGIYIKNLNTDEFLILNDGRYRSASIIKLYVMAEFFDKKANGELITNEQTEKHLSSMITLSDNYSSNYLVKTLGSGDYRSGFESINENSSFIGCINTRHLSLFSGYGDYVAYGNNFVSPLDCGILLEKIYKGSLVSPKASEEMISLLKNQTRRSKIPYYLPKDTIIANKTGETSDVESDVGIVYSPSCDYIICMLTNNSPTGIYDIRQVSLMAYNYFNPHNLE